MLDHYQISHSLLQMEYKLNASQFLVLILLLDHPTIYQPHIVELGLFQENYNTLPLSYLWWQRVYLLFHMVYS